MKRGVLTALALLTFWSPAARAVDLSGEIRDVTVYYVSHAILLFKALSNQDLIKSGCRIDEASASDETRALLTKLIGFERAAPRSTQEWEVEFRFAIDFSVDGIRHRIFAENIPWVNTPQIDVKIDGTLSGIDIGAVDLIHRYWKIQKPKNPALANSRDWC